MHLDHQMPNLWFEAHLRMTSGNFDVAGVTLPGVPFVIVGHNQRIGGGRLHRGVQRAGAVQNSGGMARCAATAGSHSRQRQAGRDVRRGDDAAWADHY
jgi:hypothetical protein